ncbi:MFS transporter [Agromyces bracchium]|uniref:MFS transporter n=1 Tax=Agromyces bracchium TaxID=88376 RepID=A0A6I3M719_9MICO|nr:MFS transporter [Agromyces bracchium]MTH69289.1 MFS transporter [Agromyces bracchium]
MARSPRPWWVAIVAGLASYIDSSAIIGFSATLVIYQQALDLEPLQVGAAAGTLTASIAGGALLGGRLGDRFGRRPVFTATMLLIIAAALLVMSATTFTLVLVGAILLGVGIGADLPVSLSTISEAAPPERRGRLIAFSNLLWAVGVVATMLLLTQVGDLGRQGAQIVFAHVAIVSTLVLIGRLGIPESATWIAARAERRAGIRTLRAERASWTDLLRREYRMPFLALIAFYSLTNLVANTNGQFGSYILVNFGGTSVAQASAIMLVSVPVVFLGMIWFMRIVDTPRRLIYFGAGAIMGVLSPLTLAVFGVTPLTYMTALLLGAGALAFAADGIMKVWTQESFPTLLRSSAQGAIIAIARLVAAGAAVMTPLVLNVGTTLLYTILATAQSVGVVIAWSVFRDRRRLDIFTTEATVHEDPGSLRA